MSHLQGESIVIVATAPFIAGHRVVETKGQTFGLVVRSRGFSGNLIAGLRSLGGGEIHEYTQLLEDTRRQALDRLIQNATLMGANAIGPRPPSGRTLQQDPAVARSATSCWSRASGRPPKSSSTPPPATGCGSSPTPTPANAGTSPRPDRSSRRHRLHGLLTRCRRSVDRRTPASRWPPNVH